MQLIGEKGAAIIDEHVQRFAVMVNQGGLDATDALARSLGDFVEALGMGEKGASMLLWMAVVDLTSELEVG